MKEITNHQLKELLETNDPNTQAPIILDVRFQEERQFGKIPQDILIPLPELESRITKLEQYKDQTIIIYCRSGGRSARACQILETNGFKDPRNLIGGILAWKEIDDSVQLY